MSTNLKKNYPKAFVPMKQEKTKTSYSKDERFALFSEGKIKVPTITKNKKRYDKKRERQKRFY